MTWQGQVLEPWTGIVSKSGPHQYCRLVFSPPVPSDGTLSHFYSSRTPVWSIVKVIVLVIVLVCTGPGAWSSLAAVRLLESAVPADHHSGQVGQ
jgi:hypothetical protein